MANTKKPERKKAINPLCGRCRHPRSLHGVDRATCKAMGCTCEGFTEKKGK